MTFQALGTVILFVALLGLGILVVLHNSRAAVNRLFFLAVLMIAGWIVTISTALSASELSHTVFLGRLGFAFASGIPFSLLCMFYAFTDSFQSIRRKGILIPGFFCLLFILLSLSPLIVSGAQPGPQRPNFTYGPVHPFFGVYFISCFAFAIYTLARSIRAASGIRKLQLRYLLLGILLGGAGATTTNLLIPLLWKTSRFSVLGPYFALLVVSFSAHAIIRHRLMNIRLVIRRGVVLGLVVAILAGVFVGLLTLITRFISIRPGDVPLAVEAALALLIALLFQPLRRWIQLSLDRYFYRETYDYQHTIRSASRKLGSMLELKSLLDYVCEVISKTLRPETVAVFIKQPDTAVYAQMTRRTFVEAPNERESQTSLPDTSHLVRFLASAQAHLLRDDIDQSSSTFGNHDALRELIQLGGEMALPVLYEGELIGLFIVGPKLSGDPLFTEDIDLLSTLAEQAAIAIKNAQLYRQVALANEYVTNIVATMESGIIAIDANGRVNLFNPAAERITGLRSSHVITSSIAVLPANLSRTIQATLLDGQPQTYAETTIPHASGRYVPVSFSTHALRHPTGHILGIVGVFSDLTRLKELEGERRRTERLASIGALASGVAHEIKNPLVAIRTFAELLPERFTEEDFRDDFSKVVIREIQRIDELVARLRGLAAPAAKPLTPLDIREPIEDTLALLRAQLEQKRVSLRRLYDDDVPDISGDSAQLKQLFLNVFMNALEAMEPGGELKVTIHPSHTRGTPRVLVKVSDTGTGIKESLLAKIFDPFVTTKPRGSGLGLAICRGIAESHGATIRAENNREGKGSTVAVEFPAALSTTLAGHEHDEIIR